VELPSLFASWDKFSVAFFQNADPINPSTHQCAKPYRYLLETPTFGPKETYCKISKDFSSR